MMNMIVSNNSNMYSSKNEDAFSMSKEWLNESKFRTPCIFKAITFYDINQKFKI